MVCDDYDDRQLEILRRMTPQQKLRVTMMLWHSVRRLKLAYLRQQHPELSEAEVNRRVKEAFLYARD
jgi:Rv0078B-related antitoxin